MNSRIFSVLHVVVLLSIVMGSKTFGGNELNVADRRYYVDIQLFSMIPGHGPDSYRGYGGGGAGGPSATVGLTVNDEQQFSLEVQTTVRSQEFIATVEVLPHKRDKKTKEMSRQFVLSNLEPQCIEIVRNDDGRVYRVQLSPRIEEIPKPRRLDVNALRLDHLSFSSSPVILNDQDYIGRLAMASGRLASIDLPGQAKVEFSLVPFRDAEPLGKLEHGVITIVHEDGTSLTISDVTNGVHREQLTGGPYEVFVRWSKSSMTEEAYRKKLTEMIADLRQRIDSGEVPDGKNWLQRLEHAQSSGRIMMMTNSLGPIPLRDRID